MTKNKRYMRKEYKLTASDYRELRHNGRMYCKEIKKDIERSKSKHDLLYTPACEKDRRKHPSWYLNGRTIGDSTDG